MTIPELSSYINSDVRSKMEEVVVQVLPHLPELPTEIFASTGKPGDSLRYPNIFLFTPHLVVEIRHPINPNRIVQYEMAAIKNSVDWIRLNLRGYEKDVGPIERSQLEIEFTTVDGLSTSLTATDRAPCQHLMEVYRRWLLPNFTATKGKIRPDFGEDSLTTDVYAGDSPS